MEKLSIQDPRWQPPFCPNHKCLYHQHFQGSWPFKKQEFYRRSQAPYSVQRFQRKHCKRSFSVQAFSQSYWQKRPDLDREIFLKICGGMAARQIARDLEVAPSTVDRHITDRS